MNNPNKYVKKEIGFGLVGTGMIAPLHIRAIKANENAWLRGVFSTSASRGRAFANKFGIKHYLTYSDMLGDNTVDVVDVVTATHLHADFAIEAIEHGKHVLVEKPIDTALEKAEKLVKLAKEKNRRLSCVSEFCFSPGITELKSMLKNNLLGKVFLIDISMPLHRDKEFFAASPWRAKKELAGGGVLAMNTIHVINILLWLFGPIKEICAKKMTIREYIEVEDCAGLLMKFENDILCLISATTASRREMPVTIEIHGTGGSIKLENFIIVNKPASNIMSRGLSYICKVKDLFKHKKSFFDICFYYQIKDIIDAIEEEREPVTSGVAGVEALRVLKRVYDSCESHCKNLDYV